MIHAAPRPRVLAAVASLALGLTGAVAASAADASWTRAKVRDGGDGLDSVTVQGKVASPGTIPAGADVRLRCGDHEQTLPASEIVRTKSVLRWKAAPGATGVQSFTLSLKKGTFTAKLSGVETGDVDDPMPFEIDAGGRAVSASLVLSGAGPVRTWKRGGAMRFDLAVGVFEVSHASGVPLITPAAGLSFPGGAGGGGITVIDAQSSVSAQGVIRVTVEIRDAALLDSMDMAHVLGLPPGMTTPPHSRVTAGDDGESQAVVFLEDERGAGQLLSPDAGAFFDVSGTDGAPSATMSVAAGAVAEELPGVTLTPFALGAELPEALPDGWAFVAGFEIGADGNADFVPTQAPTVTVSRPQWVERELVEGADVRLFRHVAGDWREQDGRGAYDAGSDRFGPASGDAARAGGTGAHAYGVRLAVSKDGRAKAAPKRRVRGRLRGRDGTPVKGQVVITRGAATITGADGAFDLAGTALAPESLELVQAIGTGRSTVRLFSGEEAEDPVVVETESVDPPDFAFGTVSGVVFEPGGATPVQGAKVVIRPASAVRGMEYDDKETPDDYLDDTLSVPDLSDLGVRRFGWHLRIPGDDEEFTSADVDRTVSPAGLLLEAQLAGRDPGEGAYTLRVTYTVPVLGEISLYAGFAVVVDGIATSILDVQLPAAVESATQVSATANSQGFYQALLYAPVGVPLAGVASRTDGRDADARSYFFQSPVSQNHVLTVGREPYGLYLPYGWSAATPLNVARRRAAAFQGVDYQLVVGGNDGNGPLATGEFFINHVEVRLTAPMSVARDWPAAVGSAESSRAIHVLGGWDGSQAVSVTEWYDAGGDSWVVRAPMPTARAALLGVGLRVGNDVLLYACGGVTDPTNPVSPKLTTVEVYAAAQNTWSAGPSLPTGLSHGSGFTVGGVPHVRGIDAAGNPRTFALDRGAGIWNEIPDGVLDPKSRFGVTGMRDQLLSVGGPTGACSLLDPVSGDWGFVPPLVPARADVAVLCDVQRGPSVIGVAWACGGTLDGAVTAARQIYRPAWVPRTPMPTARYGVAAAVLGDRVYLSGGRAGSSTLRTLEVFEPTRDLWSTKAQMSERRERHASAALDGYVFALGGRDGQTATDLASVEAYDPVTDAWESRAPMSRARVGAVAWAWDGKLFVAGGGDASVESYDPVADAWTARPPMSASRTDAVAVVVGTRAFVFGGRSSGVSLATVEAFDHLANSWSARSPIPGGGRELASAAVIGTKVYLVSGHDSARVATDGSAVHDCHLFDTTTNGWTPQPPFPFARTGSAAAAVGAAVYCFGGLGNDLRGAVLHRTVMAYFPE